MGTGLNRRLAWHDAWLDQSPLVEEALAAERLKLVFVVGMGRSGTTWLRELLAQHPGVVAHKETHLFTEYLRGVPEARAKFEQGSVGLRRTLSAHEELRAWRALVLRMLLAGLPDWPTRRAVVEKTPMHVFQASFIRELLPESYFLYILRDPRAVFASLKAGRTTFTAHWAPSGSIRTARSWAADVNAWTQFSLGAGRVRTVRYEQLHEDGRTTLDGIFAWLGLDASTEECARYVETCSFSNLRAAGWSPDYLRKGLVDGWRGDLSRREIARIERVAGPLMDELGYARSSRGHWPLPSLWLFRAAAGLERGSGRLAERLRL